MKRRFDQLDVFSATSLMGNPLAVVHAAEGLDDSTMQAFARWTNLSETTFLLTPSEADADYRVRIFTPGGELPFAGHPTLGSCAAWLAGGGVPADGSLVVQQCAIGLVRIRRSDSRLAFAAPPLIRSGPLDETLLARIAAGIGQERDAIVGHHWVDNGAGWCAVMLASAADVLAIRPDWAQLAGVKLGLVGPHPAGADALFEVRAFAPMLGGREDPVTGSLNAGLAQWLIGAGLAPTHYVAAQGTALGRSGRIHVEHDGVDCWIGGDVAFCVSGTINL
jgi:PhzF family phenazine biosynthesis protein